MSSIIFFFFTSIAMIVLFRLSIFLLPVIIIVGIIWYVFRLIFGVGRRQNPTQDAPRWENQNNNTTYTQHRSPDGPIDVNFEIVEDEE